VIRTVSAQSDQSIIRRLAHKTVKTESSAVGVVPQLALKVVGELEIGREFVEWNFMNHGQKANTVERPRGLFDVHISRGVRSSMNPVVQLMHASIFLSDKYKVPVPPISRYFFPRPPLLQLPDTTG